MADDLRSRVLAAVLGVRLNLGPGAIDLARRGESIRLSGNEADLLADAVMAVLAESAAPTFEFPNAWSPEQLAQFEAEWARITAEPNFYQIKILPPGPVEIWRRTPEERRAYLEDHRDEALAAGIPGDLIDLLIAEAEDQP